MKNNNGKIEKALKPSQRKSITPFSKTFGTGDFEEKMKLRRFFRRALIIALIILLIYFGFFLTDTLLKITEIV